MKGLAFAVSLFHRLSEEAPSRSVSAVILDVEDFAARLVEAGKRIEGAFADAVTGDAVDASTVPAAIAMRSAGAASSAQPAKSLMRAASDFMAADEVDSVRALVGGGRTAAVMDPPTINVSGTGPAPTPPAPGIGGLPEGNA